MTRAEPGQTRSRVAEIRAYGKRLADRAEAERERHRSVDALFETIDRDADVAGGIIAGALAYRLFIWLLPLALVAVAGLGIAADASSESPESAAESLGLGGLVSSSIAGAARSSARWYALLIGVPALLLATRSGLRVLIGAHRLVWADSRAAAPKPTVVGTLRLLGLLLGFAVVSVCVSAVRARSGEIGLVVAILAVLPYAALWLLVSVRLPHRGAPWTALLPGALLFGAGTELMHVAAAYVLAPWALTKQGTYGALGAAAALLVALFLFARLAVGAAALNATLWERRARAA
jgi:uncharacterized BrkB/YihY/UPF0761 family membrane protein